MSLSQRGENSPVGFCRQLESDAPSSRDGDNCETVLVSDEHPELSGYEPFEEKPLRSSRKIWMLRVVVLLAVLALVLPGFFTVVNVGTSNAERACTYRSALVDPSLQAAPRFELFGPGFLGWECYAIDRLGDEHHIDSMGLIPVASQIPRVPAQNV